MEKGNASVRVGPAKTGAKCGKSVSKFYISEYEEDRPRKRTPIFDSANYAVHIQTSLNFAVFGTVLRTDDKNVQYVRTKLENYGCEYGMAEMIMGWSDPSHGIIISLHYRVL